MNSGGDQLEGKQNGKAQSKILNSKALRSGAGTARTGLKPSPSRGSRSPRSFSPRLGSPRLASPREVQGTSGSSASTRGKTSNKGATPDEKQQGLPAEATINSSEPKGEKPAAETGSTSEDQTQAAVERVGEAQGGQSP